MSLCIPNARMTVVPAATSRSGSAPYGLSLGVARLATDPLFYADITLENIVVGSRYRITRNDTGAELATGVAASTTEVVSGVPAFANPMLIKITVRKGTTAQKYQPFETFASLIKTGVISYIFQIPDTIA